MRYIAIAIGFCFLLAPLEAKTHSSGVHIVKAKRNRVKARKAPRHHKKTRRTATN